MNAWCTLARVVSAHHTDQIPDLPRHASTIIRAEVHSRHTRRNQTQKMRSAGVSFRRFGADRRKTMSCCRKATFSSCSWAEVLSIEVRAPSTVNRRCCADHWSK